VKATGILTPLICGLILYGISAHATQGDERRFERTQYRLAVENEQEFKSKMAAREQTPDDFPEVVGVFKENKPTKAEIEDKCFADYQECLAIAVKKRKACAGNDDACHEEYQRIRKACLAVSEACGK